ncbi:MAG: hypothetical protein ABW136_09220 [Steroidobacteraceae bacterium]
MFIRPATPTVTAERTSVQGSCPECGAQSLQRYRVLSEGGWWDVVKCADCLASVERKPGPLFGTLSEALEALIPVSKSPSSKQ